MAFRGQLDMLIQRMRRAVGHPTDGATDASLLERFVAGRDEAAFELLLWRHGPMVLSVCRRMLRCDHDAEDAFQAAFLLLARKAGAIRRREAVAGWLYQTACRIALRARETARKRPVAIPPGAEPTAPDSEADAIWRDLRPVLDEEVGRLPEKYRLPIILCYLQGRTYAEASQELKCPRGTVAIRLQRARELLRGRLTRRGLALTAATMAVLAAERTVSAALPAVLVHTTLKAALVFAAGKAVAGTVSAQALTWTQGVLRTMFLSKIKILAAAVLLMGATGTGAGLLMSLKAEAPPAAKTEAPAASQQAKADKPPADAPDENEERPVKATVEVSSEREGRIALIGTEIKEGEKVPDKDRATATMGFIGKRQLSAHVGTDPTALKEADAPTPAVPAPNLNADHTTLKEADPATPTELFAGTEKRTYRRLHVGDAVEAGQLIGLVDQRPAILELSLKIAKLETAESEWRAAIKTKEEAARRAHASESLHSKGAGFISEDVYQAAMLNRDRYIEEEKGKDAARKAASEELRAAVVALGACQIRSSESGVIKEILKRPGEAIHAFEPVVRLEIESDARDAGEAAAAVFNVPSQREGVLLVVGAEAKAGAKIPANLLVTVKGDGEVKKYRRLRVGDMVEEGQLLARVDDRLARLDLEVQKSKLEAAESDLSAASHASNAAERLFKRFDKLAGAAAVDERGVSAAKSTWEQAVEAARSKEAAVRQAQVAVKEAQIVLEMYEIRSPVRGVVKAILKSRGEAVKSLETVVQIPEQRKE
jgi:RNA polymerase sigma factor (sigma-70 family)